MKNKNYKKIIALSLGLGLASPLATSHANESNITINPNTINNLETPLKNESESYKNLLEDNKVNSNIKLDKGLENNSRDFENEYRLRYDLKENIELIKKLDSKSFAEIIKDSQKLLNTHDLDKIKAQSDYLKLLIKQQENGKQLNLSDAEKKEIEKASQDFVDHGKLFEDKNADDKDIPSLAIAAIENSKDYYLAEGKLKESYDQILKLAKENQDKANTKELLFDFIASPDKENFDIPETIASEEETDLANQNFTAGNQDPAEVKLEEESQTIENPNQATGNEASQTESAFLKNDKTSSKYKELSDAQKREVDAIDTNNDGKLSNEELDASANYSSNLGSDSWLYPFTEKALNESNSEDKQTESQAENTSTEASSESENTEKKELPKTVTIDQETKSPELVNEDKKEDGDENKEEEKFNEAEANQNIPRDNKSAASIVKTGIKGLGYVVGVLIIALGAYYFLNKSQKNKK